MQYFIGIDIGSTSSKTVVLDPNKNIVLKLIQPTGWSSVETAGMVKAQLEENGINEENSVCFATGYGRVSVPFADKCLTEITCHAKGAGFIFGLEDMVVVDIGGQDTKVIMIGGGMVTDFNMNDKCSAGTGRFLEVMANILGVSPQELCDLAQNGGGTKISSMCTVFAESEVVSLIGKGEPKENIAYAVVESIVQKVVSQTAKHNLKKYDICLTGGLCDFEFIKTLLAEKLDKPIISSGNARYAGAFGAALYAMEKECRQ